MSKSSLLAAVLFFCTQARAQGPIRYSVSLANPEKHLVDVTMDLPPGTAMRELQLPVWNALYQVRDFSQFMNWIRAEDGSGHTLPLNPINASRWQLQGAASGARVEYEIFADLPGPFGAQLNSHHAFLNLAEILIYSDEERSSPQLVEFKNIPGPWRIGTPLAQQGSRYAAENYDRLVDSPVEIGEFQERDLTANGGKYRILVDLDNSVQAASPQSILDTITPWIERIVNAETAWMNDRPFDTYTFIYHFTTAPERGGMEHASSTAITLSPSVVTATPGVFASITAHEFFHLWNVKRIRPESLEPVDYTKANYTNALWFSEGVDSTVSGYMLLRAGLLDERSYLENLSQAISELENQPAHLTQSVEQSSLDAWLEKYSYYNLPDRSISYYNKGELLGILLDLKVRAATNGHASLQALFRYMNEHYAKPGKFFADTAGVRESAETLAHTSLRDFFGNYVSGVREIPWNDFFAPVGLHVISLEQVFAHRGFDAVQKFDQPEVVARVEPGSEAERAGLEANDVITRINGHTPSRDIDRDIQALGPGAQLTLTIIREGAKHDLHWTLGSRRQTIYRLEDVANISPDQRARREAWLFGTEAKP
jgi:predicted metalloprotease with PDZ domain